MRHVREVDVHREHAGLVAAGRLQQAVELAQQRAGLGKHVIAGLRRAQAGQRDSSVDPQGTSMTSLAPVAVSMRRRLTGRMHTPWSAAICSATTRARGWAKRSARVVLPVGVGIYAAPPTTWSSTVAAEVWSARQSEHPGIDRLLPYIEFVQPGPEASKLAGVWRAEARARGRSLDIPDALIAASAYHLHAAVLTRNVRDFELTPVRIETY